MQVSDTIYIIEAFNANIPEWFVAFMSFDQRETDVRWDMMQQLSAFDKANLRYREAAVIGFQVIDRVDPEWNIK